MISGLSKNLMRFIGVGIVASPLVLIGNMYYSSTRVERYEYEKNIKEFDYNTFYKNAEKHYFPNSELE